MSRKSVRKRSASSKRVTSKQYAKSLRSIGRKSAREAYRENKALKLPVTYISRGKVVQETADGEKRVLDTLDPVSSIVVSKGTVKRVKKD